MDPSTSYRSIRITSSTSIQTTVTTSLLHLSDPSSPALILHTLPIPSSSNNTAANSIAIVPKNTHAALCKLISIIEIIKREFENHQKESWRLQDEKEKRKLAKRRSISKGKKRARDEQEQDDDDVEMLNKEEGGETRDTGSLKVVVDSDTNEANVVGGAKGTSTKSKNATSTTTTAISDKKSTTTTSSSLKEKKKQRKKDRPLLRIYQYNLLDAYEKLPGVVSSALDIVGEGEEDSSDNDSSSSESDNDDDEEEVEDRENKKIEQDLIKSKLKAAKSLDDAIKNHVIRARRR